MKIEKVKLSQVRVNAANPRTITDTKFRKLIDSLLALPKMLDMRPVVVDNTMTALGGNMRYRALCAIAEMDETELRRRIAANKDVQKKTEAERTVLADYWLLWKDAPTVPIIRASELTDDERRQFIIKDNASFGQWDYDALANQWDAAELNSWGVDVWPDDTPTAVTGGWSGSGATTPSPTTTQGVFDPSTLPEELQGHDLTPDDLPKIEGDDERPCERIIITYRKEQAEQVAAFCGLEKLSQVVYEFDALPAANK